MTDFKDIYAAQLAVSDTSTSAAELAQIAGLQPSLRAAVAIHPNAYRELLDWLAEQGDAQVQAIVASRKAGGQQEQPQPGLSDAYGYPIASKPKKKMGKLLTLSGVGVLLVALVVTGAVTRGFGLFGSGGASTPEEEAGKVAQKVISAINSFSSTNLFNNPFGALSALNEETAPSEALLQQVKFSSGSSDSGTEVNLTDLLGINADTISLAAELFGSFKAELQNPQFSTEEIDDDVAKVSLVGGQFSADVDIEKMRAALDRVPEVLDKQVADTAAKLGFRESTISLSETLPNGWQENWLDGVQRDFPLAVDLSTDLEDYQKIQLSIIVVREGGKWYYSPMLTQAEQLFTSSYGYSDPQMNEIRGHSSVTPGKNSSPVDAASGMADAVDRLSDNCNISNFAKQLPLAERRAVEIYGEALLGSSCGSFQVSAAEFSEIRTEGDFARVRIDDFMISTEDYYGDKTSDGIQNGTCFHSEGYSYQKVCLSDLIDSREIRSLFDNWRQNYIWNDFEQQTGIRPDDVIDKLETAAVTTLESIDPDQIGVVAVREGDSWYISATATSTDLIHQAGAAINAGLKTIS
jgi:hypothetical protein